MSEKKVYDSNLSLRVCLSAWAITKWYNLQNVVPEVSKQKEKTRLFKMIHMMFSLKNERPSALVNSNFKKPIFFLTYQWGFAND